MNKLNLLASVAGLIIGSLGMTATASAQTVYRAVDELGNPAFTDRAEEYEGAEPMGITLAARERRRAAAQARDTQESNDDSDDKYASFAQSVRDDQAAEDAAEAAEDQDVKAANCEKANKRLDKYKSARRLFRQNDAGEREYLSDEETDTARADAARSVDQWCGS